MACLGPGTIWNSSRLVSSSDGGKDSTPSQPSNAHALVCAFQSNEGGPSFPVTTWPASLSRLMWFCIVETNFLFKIPQYSLSLTYWVKPRRSMSSPIATVRQVVLFNLCRAQCATVMILSDAVHRMRVRLEFLNHSIGLPRMCCGGRSKSASTCLRFSCG